MSQLGLANQMLCLIITSYILTIPYALSLVDYCYMPLLPPPLKLSKA